MHYASELLRVMSVIVAIEDRKGKKGTVVVVEAREDLVVRLALRYDCIMLLSS